MLFKATFNNISAISWRWVFILLGESGPPGDNTTLVVIGTDCIGRVVKPTTIRSRPRRPPLVIKIKCYQWGKEGLDFHSASLLKQQSACRLVTLFWFWTKQSSLFLLNAACLAENTNFIIFGMIRAELKPRSTVFEASTLTNTPLINATMRLVQHCQYHYILDIFWMIYHTNCNTTLLMQIQFTSYLNIPHTVQYDTDDAKMSYVIWIIRQHWRHN